MYCPIWVGLIRKTIDIYIGYKEIEVENGKRFLRGS